MEEALKEAQKAAALGEVPIGAVIVRGGEIVGRGHNMTEPAKDPTAVSYTHLDVYKRQTVNSVFSTD